MKDVGQELERVRAQDTAAVASSSALDDLWKGIEPETTGARPTFFRRLRELSTPTRIGLALLATLAVGALSLVAVGGARNDLDTSDLVLRYALLLFGLCVLACAVFAVALRGAHQRPLGWRGWVIVLGAVAVPFALSLVPSIWHGDHGPSAPVVHGCNIIGGVTGVFAAGVAWLFQRSTTPVVMRVLASAAGGGIVAFAMLQLHCPADDVEHLILGHAIVGLGLVALAGIGVAVRRYFFSQ